MRLGLGEKVVLAFVSCMEISPMTLLVGAVLSLLASAAVAARAVAQAKVRARSRR